MYARLCQTSITNDFHSLPTIGQINNTSDANLHYYLEFTVDNVLLQVQKNEESENRLTKYITKIQKENRQSPGT